MSATPISEAALITGASSGIGRDLAELFARDRNDLVLVARRLDLLNETAASLQRRFGVGVLTVQSDLARPQAPAEIMARIEQQRIRIHTLVNNAGFGRLGFFAESNPSDDLDMIQVNVSALTALARLALMKMVERGRGRILNIASTAAFQPGPLMAVYYASKAYVLSFSEALANELRGTGVTVTVLCPGPTRTGFQAAAGLGDSTLGRAPMMDSATVARIGYQGMLRGDSLVIPGMANKVLAQGTRWVPRKLSAAIVRRIQEGRRGGR